MLELLQMWALVEVLGIICLPLTFTIFKNLPDRGWAFTKIVGMALLAFCVWLPLMTLQFLPFSQLFIAGVLLIILAFNVIGYARIWKSVLQLIRTHLVYILACELVFLGMVFLLGWIRSYGPNIQGFEMYMDEGFLAAIMRSPHFPPSDMWLSGYPINYYYYAHYVIAMLAKLMGQSPSIAFNTGISTYYGLTAVNIFGVTCNIVAWAMHRRRRNPGTTRARSFFFARRDISTRSPALSLAKAMPFGVLSLLMGEVLGNLASTQAWFQQHGDLPYFYWFNVSRVVDPPKTINEFPAFSFLLSCFHAHVLTLAFTILAVAAIFNIFLEQGGNGDDDAKGMRVFGRGWRLPINLGFMALVLGGLFTMNGWDLPTYLGMAVVCVALQQWMAYRRFCLELVLDVFTTCASLIALSFFFYAPFYLNFISPSQGIGIVNAVDRSKISEEMLVYGTFMFIFVSFLLVNLFRDRAAASAAPAIDPGAGPVLANAPEHPSTAHGLRGFGTIEAGNTKTNSKELAVTAASSAQTQPRQQFASVPHALVQPQEEFNSSEDDELEISRQDTQFPAAILPGGEQQTAGQTKESRLKLPSWLSVPMLSQVLILAVALLMLVVLKNSLWFVVTFVITALGVEQTLMNLHDRPRAFTLLLGTVAFALVALTEVVYLRDVFAGNFPRMNTVFKFYFQAWALLSITSGAGLYFIFESFQTAPPMSGINLWMRRCGQGMWSLVCLALLLAGAIYPIVATYQRTNEFMQRSNSLDGFAYMQSYYPGDYAAINWLNSHVQGNPVLLEAYGPNGGDYSDYGRVSAFTGLPTLMGWVGHEYQWRVNWLNNIYNATDFYRRGSDINTIYMSTDSRVVLGLLQHYQVKYLYVGSLEITTYAGSDLGRFRQFMPIVYSANGVTIYQVPGSA